MKTYFKIVLVTFAKKEFCIWNIFIMIKRERPTIKVPINTPSITLKLSKKDGWNYISLILLGSWSVEEFISGAEYPLSIFIDIKGVSRGLTGLRLPIQKYSVCNTPINSSPIIFPKNRAVKRTAKLDI